MDADFEADAVADAIADAAFGRLREAWESGTDADLPAALTALARRDHAPACAALATALLSGRPPFPQDPATAFVWALRGAHGGFAVAQALAGDFYLHAEPEHGACVRDVSQAARWHVAAAEAGHAGAALAASDAFRMGRGVPRDFRRAAYFLGLCTALDPAPPGITALLRPSLATDLGEDTLAEVDRAVAAAVAALPRRDADLEGFWLACAASGRGAS